MQGVCLFCGEPTSTKRTKRCYKCYRKQLWVKRSPRDKRVISDIIQGNLSAAQTSRKHGISREMVRLILQDNGIDYADILRRRRQSKEKNQEETEKKDRTRTCKNCGDTFTINENGGRVKYCSTRCYEKKYKELQRQRVRRYYHTPKGKRAVKAYQKKNKEKIKKYLKRYHSQRANPERFRSRTNASISS